MKQNFSFEKKKTKQTFFCVNIRHSFIISIILLIVSF